MLYELVLFYSRLNLIQTLKNVNISSHSKWSSVHTQLTMTQWHCQKVVEHGFQTLLTTQNILQFLQIFLKNVFDYIPSTNTFYQIFTNIILIKYLLTNCN